MIRVQTIVWCSISEGVEIAGDIARMLVSTYGREYVHAETALWGVSVEAIDMPQPEEGFEGFHALLEDGTECSF